MKNRNQSKIFVIIIIVVILVLFITGWVRDHIFVEINSNIKLISDSIIQQKDSAENNIAQESLQKLYISKWALTFYFSAFYFLLACITIKVLFNNNKYIYYTATLYLLFLITAFIFYTGGILFDARASGYILARRFMGMVQSPILLMFLIPVFKIVEIVYKK